MPLPPWIHGSRRPSLRACVLLPMMMLMLERCREGPLVVRHRTEPKGLYAWVSHDAMRCNGAL